VLDTANGATYRVAPAAFTELGADVTVIHNEPNGLNINENCGSQHTGDLRKAVVETGAAIGLAFDGDGDRLIAVDEKGNEITGDQILIICADMLKSEGRLTNDLLVSTIMSNMGLRVAAKKYGFGNHAAKVGDRYVLEDMQRLGSVLGGEESGHVIFLEHHTTGDGILTAMQLLAAMLKAGKPLSELAQLMDVFPQKLINVDVKSKPDIESVPQIVEAIRQVEAELGDEGRVLVRYSGTQNMCRVMVEGPTSEVTDTYAAQLAEVVKTAIG
jgi:phosphoglucosamine mutase